MGLTSSDSNERRVVDALFFAQEEGTDVYNCTSCTPCAQPDRKPASPQTRYAQFADTLTDWSTEMPEPVTGSALSSVRIKYI